VNPGTAPRLPYLPALDGLRALAVISVLLYHANLNWIPGGFLGVEMFFVISGYLITSLLLSEWRQTGRIDLKAFWLRRARRLLPALFLLLLAVGGYAIIFLPDEVASLRGDIFSTAGYINNWYQIFAHKSYFETVGRPSLLRHMWSLAVEEQFYLVWPLLFLLLARLRRRYALLVVLLGALASSLAMAMLFDPNTDPSRPYYGTDTRAAGLLLGIALALMWPPGEEVVSSAKWTPDVIGFAGLGTVFACFLLINEFQPFLYRGGFTLTGIATAELLAVAVHPRARLLPRLLAWEPLRWVGLRSYGIYLWHFPVFMLTRPHLDVPYDGLPLLAARLGLTAAIAALSYHFVETPIRNGALARGWAAWRQARGASQAWWTAKWATGSLSVVAACSFLGVFLLTAKPPAPPEYLKAASSDGRDAPHGASSGQQNREAAGRVPAGFSREAAVSNTSAPELAGHPLTAATQTVAGTVTPALLSTSGPALPLPAAAHPMVSNSVASTAQVTAIGDSVMEGVAEELKHNLGSNTVVNADQGRLPWNTPAIVHDLHATGKLSATIVLQIGNNGYLSPDIFSQIMAEFKDARRIVVVNLKVPRRWESPNNSLLASAVKTYPNAVLVDWHAASVDHPRFFWKDGLHVRPEGARIYADLVTRAITAR
jgi:peptidoglycan/LPS O-acetylase OafA/YrhL